MKGDLETRPAGAQTFETVADVAVESLLAVGLLFAMDALAHLKLTPGGFGLLVAGWVAALLAGRLTARAAFAPNWLPGAIELVLPALWVVVCNGQLKQPWSVAQTVYATLLVSAVWNAWRWLLARAGSGGWNRQGEALRLLLVGLAAGEAVLPFFTDRQLGGTDARWYTGVFIDFISQLRSGFFPVFVGQGEFSFNGSVNLFRSAPLCLWLGGVWDQLTAQSLSPIAIRNLAVITASLGAGYGMYAVLVRLQRTVLANGPAGAWSRWIAALIAVLYVQCPSVLHALYYYELQMTFTALLALPWILYGNIRTLHGTDGRGYVPLAAGLALAWLAHAPLAIISMLGTAALQFGRFIFEPAAIAQWRAAAGGALLFALLGAYYFLGMSELPSGLGPGLRTEAVFLAGIILVVFGVVRLFHHRHWTGALVWLLGAGLVALTIPVWLAWVVAWGALFGLTALIHRWAGAEWDGARAVLWATAAMLGAAALAGLWAASRDLPHDLEPMKSLARNVAVRSELFLPLPPAHAMTPYGSSQPGYALVLLTGLVVFSAWGLRSLALSLLAAVIVFLAAIIVGAPLVSDFILAFAPPQIVNVVTLPMFYRLIPPLAALIGVAGFLSLGLLGRRHDGWLRWGGLVLAAGVAWSSWEAQKLVGLGWRNLTSREATGVAFAPQNYALGRYSYAMLVTPTAYNDGKQFPWLESRLLNQLGDLVVGPGQVAQQAEEFDSTTLVLTSRVDPTNQEWLHLTPEWQVQPGETLLLRLEFPGAVDSSGYLILRSEHGYQEFHLTPSYPGTGFGLGASASHVLSVTNPGIHIEHYHMLFKVDPGNTMPRDGGPWAKLHVSPYKAEQAPVQLLSLLPYRARVTATSPGFLEIPRQWLAGYRARVDGQTVAAAESPGAFIKVPVTAGTHTVELAYVGTPRLWIGLVISSAALSGLLGWWITGGWERNQSASLLQWIEVNKP